MIQDRGLTTVTAQAAEHSEAHSESPESDRRRTVTAPPMLWLEGQCPESQPEPDSEKAEIDTQIQLSSDGTFDI